MLEVVFSTMVDISKDTYYHEILADGKAIRFGDQNGLQDVEDDKYRVYGDFYKYNKVQKRALYE